MMNIEFPTYFFSGDTTSLTNMPVSLSGLLSLAVPIRASIHFGSSPPVGSILALLGIG